MPKKPLTTFAGLLRVLKLSVAQNKLSKRPLPLNPMINLIIKKDDVIMPPKEST